MSVESFISKINDNFSFKIIVSFLVFFFMQTFDSQSQVTVDDTSFTANDLVDILVSDDCVTTSNFQISSNRSVAYFNNNGSNFPIQEGIIIRNGIARNSAGRFTDTNLSSQVDGTSQPDQDLNEISNDSGQSSQIFDVALLSFDFISQSSEFEFDFVFASNEYGEFQCGFSDVFGFILTDVETGEKQNLAILPNTGDVISVKTIRDEQFNNSCNSVNPALFSTLNNVNDPNSSINMRGYTTVLNANANIEANKRYNLKLVIGDFNDTNFDSAVFIGAGSFNEVFTIGEDFVQCEDEPFTLDTEVAPDAGFNFRWFRNGQLLIGENESTYSGTQLGTYRVVASNPDGCEVVDEIVISQIQFSRQPPNLFECDAGPNTPFNLAQYNLNYFGFDPTRYELEYFNNINDANNNQNQIPESELNAYESAGNETIYIKLKSLLIDENCQNLITSFTLNTVQFQASEPDDIEVCQENGTINIPNQVNSQILQGLNASEYSISFFDTFNDANANENELDGVNQFNISNAATVTLFARTESNVNPNCFDIVDFNVTIFELPPVDDLADVIECTSFTLPPLTNGRYYSRSGGTGTEFFVGDVLVDPQIVYIYNEDANGCTNETFFSITILEKFELNDQYCESFTVFDPPNGDFYTAPDGPNGTGEAIPAGTVLTESQIIYYYATVDDSECQDRAFDLQIEPRPEVDSLENVATCTSYELPTLTNGRYFTGPNGTGTEIPAGTEISQNQLIYIYNFTPINPTQNGGFEECGSETSFQVFKIDIDDFQDVERCGSYTLPSLNVGAYYTEEAGQGEQIQEGTVITSSQRIYYFVETVEPNNCTTNLAIDITIYPIPEVDSLENVVRCIDNPYELPVLTNGNYFTQASGQGTQLNAGDVIGESQTIFIYNANENCDAQTSFDVEIRLLPEADVFTDIFTCEPYTLPVLQNGNYFTEPNGQGTQLNPGDVITETQTIYIFARDPDLSDCVNENIFTVQYLGITVDELDDVQSCDSYVLPELTVGEYFTEQNGEGTRLNPGDVITEDTQLYIYAENGNRFFCFDEDPVFIDISTTPTLQNFDDIESCGSYTLEEIIPAAGNRFQFYRSPNKVDLINPQDYTITEVGTQTIYAVESVIENENCFDEKSFTLTIFPLLDLQIDDVIICEDFDTGESLTEVEIRSGLDPNKFTADWFFDGQLIGSGVNITVNQKGTYRIVPIRTVPEVGADCNFNPAEVNVIASSPKVKVTYLSSPFVDDNSVQVDFINQGLGDYIYQLEDGLFQSSNIFSALETGVYTITIRDTTGICPDFQITFTALDYPRNFSPNNDGVNDFWNIPDLKEDYPEALIRIYDRFGNQVSAFRAKEQGWNGQRPNGELALASSYWFKVEFIFQGEPTTFEAYFSLERN